MNPELKHLSPFLEQQDFVEYQGELYYTGDNIDQLISQGFEFTEGKLEKTEYIASRRNVGCKPLKSQPYVQGYDLKERNEITYDGTRVIKPDSGVIPDSEYLIIKKLVDLPPDPKPTHVIYSKEQDAYYCMSNVCTTCNVVPVKIKAEYKVVSADIAAQEPLASTLVSREPKWAEVFELRNLRYDPKILQYMDIIFESYLRIPRRDSYYVMFLHDTYFYDRTDIYQLNNLVNELKIDESKRQELESHIQMIIAKFTTHKEQIVAKETK